MLTVKKVSSKHLPRVTQWIRVKPWSSSFPLKVFSLLQLTGHLSCVSSPHSCSRAITMPAFMLRPQWQRQAPYKAFHEWRNLQHKTQPCPVLRAMRLETREFSQRCAFCVECLNLPDLREAGLLPRRVLFWLLITVSTSHENRNSRDRNAKQPGTIKNKTWTAEGNWRLSDSSSLGWNLWTLRRKCYCGLALDLAQPTWLRWGSTV